ncbi:anthranilate phosphoribosyltransferase [Fructobacillus fructosus]|uniref:Anthranilate phosphoribosyltransferase n=1 Tax=Fructobacillus fructosus TaxID=1631 RepID=A0ABM9MTN7_9LACO|nr:Anthranilate phosphoribosyltransferase [Fructobacillus fructosus]
MLQQFTEKIQNKQSLTFDESKAAIQAMMSGDESDVAIASFLTALADKGESDVEIAGGAAGMRAMAKTFPAQPDGLDIVGTGGDHSNSFNISSTTGILLAAMGVKVVKHGNRAASSKSGAADVLEALNFPIHQSQEASESMLARENFTFLFAQDYHPAMKAVGPIRSKLGIRTIFNLLGPLANPAAPEKMVLGVAKPELLEPMAQVLHQLGVQRADVIYGTDGLDEASISAPTKIVSLRGDAVTYQTIKPEDVGLKSATKSAITGGSGEENAQITQAILAGKEKGPRRDVVLLNAGIALSVVDSSISIEQGIKQAQAAIDSGAAIAKLTALTTKEVLQ